MKFSVLASGSKGNSTFIETNETKVKLTTFSVVQKIFPEITFEEVTSWGVNWS